MSVTQTTANNGWTLPGTTHPDVTNSAGALALLVAALIAVDASHNNVQKLTVAGAITVKSGTAFLNTGAASAITLAAPTAGLPAAGGNDGQRLAIIALDAFAYVVTTPANKINGNEDTATWAAAVGNSIELVAWNGVWYVVGTSKGITLTEV